MSEEYPTSSDLELGFWVDDWFVEPMLNRIIRDDTTVQLEPKVMQVLCCMAQQPEKTVTKEAFKERVWTGTVVTDDVLSRCISELRKALGDDSRDPDYIETIRKTGYRLIAPVHYVSNEEDAHPEAAAPSGAYPAGAPGKPGVANGRSSNRSPVKQKGAAISTRATWIGGVVFVCMVFGALLYTYGRSDEVDAQPPPTSVPFTSFPGEESDPALSPDGNQVVFTWDGETGPYKNLYIKQSGAETPLRITNAPANDFSPAWSPDGQFIAFGREQGARYGVYVVSSIGGTTRKVAEFNSRELHDVAWSPDESQNELVLSVRPGPFEPFALYSLSMTTNTLSRITAPPSYSLGDTSPRIAPDGRKIAFVRGLIGEIEDVFVTTRSDSVGRQMTFDSTRVGGIDWAKNGQQIVFSSDRGGNFGLWQIGITGGREPEWITGAGKGNSLLHPTASRRGNRLAYVQRSGNVDIWSWRRGRVGWQSFIASTQWDSHPSIAPDGNHIAYVSRRSGHPEVWISNAEGTEPVQLTSFEGPPTSTPRWSPNGQQLSFVSHANGRSSIYTVDIDQGSPRPLNASSNEALMPSWSQNGRWIYFSSNQGGAWQIWRASVDSSLVEQVTRGPALAAQESTDGNRLFIVRPDTSGIWAIPLGPEGKAPLHQDRARLLADKEPPVTTVAYRAEDEYVDPMAGIAPPDPDTSSDTTRTDSTQRTEQDSLAFLDAEQVVPDLSPNDYGNWFAGEDAIYYVRRTAAQAELVRHSLATGRSTVLSILDQMPRHPALGVAPDGQWFLQARVDQPESDIFLMEDFGQ